METKRIMKSTIDSCAKAVVEDSIYARAAKAEKGVARKLAVERQRTRAAEVAERQMRQMRADQELIQRGVGSLRRHPAAAKGLSFLEKVLGNLRRHPMEPKYRQLRLSNPKVAAVVGEDGLHEP